MLASAGLCLARGGVGDVERMKGGSFLPSIQLGHLQLTSLVLQWDWMPSLQNGIAAACPVYSRVRARGKAFQHNILSALGSSC